MGTLTTGMTLADLAKGMDPNGQPARIIELLNQKNDILEDIVWSECNNGTTNRSTQRTGLPTVAARLLNAGVQPGNTTTAQIDDATALFEAWSSVDAEIVRLGGQGVRLPRAKAFMEAMKQKVVTTFFYGSASTPGEFVGLAPRYSSTTAGNGAHVLKAGGTGSDNASIWLIAHDTETICGLYPQNTQGGLDHKDLGEETENNAAGVTGALMRVFRDQWIWRAGVAVKDWRAAVRITNIDVSDLAGGTPADLIDYMEQAEETLPNDVVGKRVFYMNRTIRRYLRKQARTDVTTGGGLTFANVGGMPITMFGTTPVRIVDALTNAETLVS